MSEERLKEVKEKIINLERRILPLEWDASRKQINEFKLKQLGKLKEEFQLLKTELNELQVLLPK